MSPWAIIGCALIAFLVGAGLMLLGILGFFSRDDGDGGDEC